MPEERLNAKQQTIVMAARRIMEHESSTGKLARFEISRIGDSPLVSIGGQTDDHPLNVVFYHVIFGPRGGIHFFSKHGIGRREFDLWDGATKEFWSEHRWTSPRMPEGI